MSQQPRTASAISADGTAIDYLSLGDGPGLILLGGVLSSVSTYLALAEALAADFTVHVVNRRGRPPSGPQRPGTASRTRPRTSSRWRWRPRLVARLDIASAVSSSLRQRVSIRSSTSCISTSPGSRLTAVSILAGSTATNAFSATVIAEARSRGWSRAPALRRGPFPPCRSGTSRPSCASPSGDALAVDGSAA
jgi:hypothetical protein